eukprot:gnl/TRDRNA2_/TRDRNA2_182780_c0_seq1.p1 gnl/TRDRNA2_/TRDRNA2_182780_c0~~gnl/TRDRNA2_/TRDRNA2_182780_c0_seq1.p1  ORF type:complete len:711 (-),score=113.44 gnl/TRDRNA2_/TRDRNA2_182780_c0_seq1:87-1991(-)
MADVDVASLWPQWAGKYMQQRVPGLGISVVRYNVGGTGRVADRAGEARSSRSRGWHAEIEGFRPLPSGDFDWSRDQEQRHFLRLAVERGATDVEFFSNAPMWWMSHSSSSFGGNLSLPSEFASYLAEVVVHARREWKIPVKSVAPFNEPSAGWWRFPHDQEGCDMTLEDQVHVLTLLRRELDARGLKDVLIAASDENRPDTAIQTLKFMQQLGAAGHVGRLNVHTYDGLLPWREVAHPGVRASLRNLASQQRLPVWVSEHGNGDVHGVQVAEAILEDLNFLKPAAWCYWQPLEHRCSWGLVEVNFDAKSSISDQLPLMKYYVFAHFSRYLRPNVVMLHCTEPWATGAYSPEEGALVCVVANVANQMRRMRMCLHGFSVPCSAVTAVLTQPQTGRLMVERSAQVVEDGDSGASELIVEVPARAVCSMHVPGAVLVSKEYFIDMACYEEDQLCEAVVASIREMARSAAKIAVSERCYGCGDKRTVAERAHWEHNSAHTAAVWSGGAAALSPSGAGDSFEEIREMMTGAAWGAANERAFGPDHADTRSAWARFHHFAERFAEKFEAGSTSVELFVQEGVAEDLKWMVFNIAWEVMNAFWYGPESSECECAKGKAEYHFHRVVGHAVTVPGSPFPLPP